MAKKATRSKLKLAAADYEPLLVAISSRAVDTCLLGAKCLALLEDPRAFGLLVQLSRNSNADVRLEVCRSFEQLGDRRASDRLCAMLDDREVKVRDAAFSAFHKICTDANETLVAAAQGMAVSFEDIRLRGLESLIRHAKKGKAIKQDDEVTSLLKQALNDSKSVRNETFKFVLNSKIGGGEDATLRFLLQSSHADVRQDVLTEIKNEKEKPWFHDLIQEMLSDPDESIRKDAFEFLGSKNKNADNEEKVRWLALAIKSEHADIRLAACEQLVKLKTREAQAVLAEAINDESLSVRQFALKSLISRNATEVLVAALESSYLEVQIASATALARQGNSKARPTLEKFIAVEMPTEGDEKQKLWEQLTTKAIDGLAELEDSNSVGIFIDKATHQNQKVRQCAARALRWVANAESFQALQPLLRHEEPAIRLSAAYASALHGDVTAARLVLSPESVPPLSELDQQSVAIALNDVTESSLIQMLDDSANPMRSNTAWIVLLCRDWLAHDGTPSRIVSALAASDPRIRLSAAAALQAFNDPIELTNVVVDFFNNRAEEQPFEIEVEVVRTVAAVLVFGKAPLICRVVEILDLLGESKQDSWNNSWYWISERYSKQISEAVAQSETDGSIKPTTKDETLQQLAFGTYVGLARDQSKNYRRLGWKMDSIRQAALYRLASLAKSDDEFLDPTVSVMTHVCGDTRQALRLKAFEVLSDLDVDDKTRARIGIESGNLDLAVQGLQLLTKSAKKAERKEILTQAILNQSSSIGIEAAKMLRTEIGSVETCKICMDAPSSSVASVAVNWVAEDMDDESSGTSARKLIRKLAKDSAKHLRVRAIEALVKNQDDHAFESVESVVSEKTPSIDRQQCYRWFVTLGDIRASEVLLELLDNSELDTDPKALLNVIGGFRDTESVPRLLELMDRTDLVSAASSVVYKISGFDQPILDPNDEWPDRQWMDSQHPRHGDVLGDLMNRAIELNLNRQLNQYLPSARWCVTNDVDRALERLVSHPDDKIRRNAVEAIGFRADKRKGKVDVLVDLVENAEPLTQFLAAEALAKAGRDEGIQILMSAVEMMDDLHLRRRAVLALGRLADERALDQLLKLVAHDGHALQDYAAEAIGYLGDSDKREEILQRLLSLVDQQGSAGQRALVGLRHMNESAGWDRIRTEAKSDHDSAMRQTAWMQIGYDPSDASQDVIIKMLKSDVFGAERLLASARKSFGLDSVLPDLAYLEGYQYYDELGPLELECLKNVFEKATPEQVFELISCCPGPARRRLANHLMSLDPLPVQEALSALEHSDPRTVVLAADVLGRVGDKKYSKSIVARLQNWIEDYQTISQSLKQQNQDSDSEFLAKRKAMIRLIWSAGRIGGAEKILLDFVCQHDPDDHFRQLRRSAMESLVDSDLPASTLDQVKDLLSDYDPVIREGAGVMMLNYKKANVDELAEALLTDRHSFDQLASQKDIKIDSTVDSAAESVHYQPRAIPLLIEQQKHQSLATIAENDQLDLQARLGAIEGLAKMANKESQESLVEIGNNESNDEALRKAAWRGLRRSKRKQKLIDAH